MSKTRIEPLELPGETPEQTRARWRKGIRESSAQISPQSRAATQARIHAIKTGEIKPRPRTSGLFQAEDFGTCQPQTNCGTSNENGDAAMTETVCTTEDQVRAELSRLTKEDLELIAGVHILFKDGVPQEMIRNHYLRKSVARELLNLLSSSNPEKS